MISTNVISIMTVLILELNALYNCLQHVHDKNTDRCRMDANPADGILIRVIMC